MLTVTKQMKDIIIDAGSKSEAVIVTVEGESGSASGSYMVESINDSLSSRCGIQHNASLLLGCEVKPKPITRTEYVNVEFETAWESIRAFESGEKFYRNVYRCSGSISEKEEYGLIENGMACHRAYNDENIFRKVEKEITWYEDAINYAKSCRGINDAIYSKEDDSIDIDGSMTRQECNEYAKLLLENC